MGLDSHGLAPWLGDHQLGIGLIEFLGDSSYRLACLGGWNWEQGQCYVGWIFWEASHGVFLEGKHIGRCVEGG